MLIYSATLHNIFTIHVPLQLCEKNRNIYSDIEAAALKAYKPEELNNDYIEENNIRNTEKKLKEKEKDANKDFDIVRYLFSLI